MYLCEDFVKSTMQKIINIKNKKARFNFEIIEVYTAGIQLKGSEIKSIRLGKANITESFCEFNENGELFIINMYVEEYIFASHFNHNPRATRKLLLNKRELKNLKKSVDTKGNTIVPLRMFLNKRGLAKLEISLAKGKKIYDKREAIKERDIKRYLNKHIRK